LSSSPRSGLLAVAEEAGVGALHLFWGGSLATALSAVCSILVARLLGPELYGVYSISLVVSGFLMLFTDFGVSQAITRFTALYSSRGEQGRVTSLLKTSLAFGLAVSIAVSLAGLALADQLTSLLVGRPDVAHLVRLTLILIVVQPISALLCSALLGLGDMRGYAAVDVVRQAVRASLSPLLALSFGVWGAVVGYVTAYVAGLLASLALFYRRYAKVRGSRGPEAGVGEEGLKDMLSYGFPLYLSGALGSLAATVRGVALAHFTTNFEIGNFNAAMNFAVLVTLVSSPIATALFPAFSKLDSSEARTMFAYSVKYTSALVIPAAALVSALSQDLISIVYGDVYSRAPLYLALYSTTFLLAGLGSVVLGSFFSGVGDTRVNLKATLIYVVLFAPSAVALTSALRVEGLVTAMIVATAASTVYSLRVATRKYGMWVDLKASAKICLAALLAAIPTALLATHTPLPMVANLALCASLYLLIYSTAAPLLGGLTRRDVEALAGMFEKVAVLRPFVRALSSYEVKVLRLAERLKSTSST